MATKTQERIELKVENADADVHHIVRRVGVQDMPDGTITADKADATIRNWLQAGYKLAFVSALGLEPNGVNVLYILTKNA